MKTERTYLHNFRFMYIRLSELNPEGGILEFYFNTIVPDLG